VVQRIGSAAGLVALLSALTLSSPAAGAPVTVGANVEDTSNTFAVGCSPACTFQDVADTPVQTMQSPCTGVVTRWRVNAAAGATFKLRIIRDNGVGTFTSTASSADQTTSGAGIAVFPASIPISAGEYIGVDLQTAGSILGRFLVADVEVNLFRPPMVDGVPQGVESGLPEAGLVNADVACPHSLNVINAGIGKGTVTSAPAGLSCGATCSADYLDGTQVSLTATPAPGSIFVGWGGGGCSGTGGCQVTMSSDQTVAAGFAAAPSPGGPTGQRAAALEECGRRFKQAVKKKRAGDELTPPITHHLKKKLRKCKQRANQLPA
jgi:hypothetical protein